MTSNISQTINGVIEGLTQPVLYSVPPNGVILFLAKYSRVDDVRVAIHGMLRIEICHNHPAGVLSPAFPGKSAKPCIHITCPYVIGTAIYLWVAQKLGTMFHGEDGSSGCSFYHPKDDQVSVNGNVRGYHGIRDEVYAILDDQYGHLNVMVSPPVMAWRRIREYYHDVINPKLPNTMVWDRAVTSERPKVPHFAKMFAVNLSGSGKMSDRTLYASVINMTDVIYQPLEAVAVEVKQEIGDAKFMSLDSIKQDPKYAYDFGNDDDDDDCSD